MDRGCCLKYFMILMLNDSLKHMLFQQNGLKKDILHNGLCGLCVRNNIDDTLPLWVLHVWLRKTISADIIDVTDVLVIKLSACEGALTLQCLQ